MPVRSSAVLLLFAASAVPAAEMKDLVYAHTPQRDLTVDLYLPATPQPHPVILYVHGGGWSSGSKANPPTSRLVAVGYAVASIDYRLTNEAPFPAQIFDCKASVRWLRANSRKYGLDADRIAAWGGSAGGHLVALLGTSGGVAELEGDEGNPGYSSRLAAVIDFFGPVDLMTINAERKHPRPESGRSAEAKLLGGGPLEDHKDLARQASPLTWIDPSDPPFLVVHGDLDDTVPPKQSERFVEALKAAHVPVEFSVVKGRAHGFRTGPDVDPIVDGFLQKHFPVRSR